MVKFDASKTAEAFHNEHVRNIRAQRIQCDEIWQFVGAKQKNATPEQKAAGWGDTWTWTAIDADTKLMVSWFLGSRDAISRGGSCAISPRASSLACS